MFGIIQSILNSLSIAKLKMLSILDHQTPSYLFLPFLQIWTKHFSTKIQLKFLLSVNHLCRLICQWMQVRRSRNIQIKRWIHQIKERMKIRRQERVTIHRQAILTSTVQQRPSKVDFRLKLQRRKKNRLRTQKLLRQLFHWRFKPQNPVRRLLLQKFHRPFKRRNPFQNCRLNFFTIKESCSLTTEKIALSWKAQAPR